MRLIQGRNGWWCIAESGTALVPDSMVADGRLTAAGRHGVTELGILAPRPMDHYSLTVLTSTNCNLGCPYCFQNTAAAAPGKFNPPRIGPAVLGREIVDPIVSFARNRMADLGVSRLVLLLFGGEPLLNPLGCREVLRRCGEATQMYGVMISNGTLLHRRLAVQLFEAGLRRVQITLDGPAWLHDTVRTTRSGRATFDAILANVAAAQEATDLRFTFRVNLTSGALAGIGELIERVAGAVDASRCGLGITPVMDYGWGFDDLVNPTSVSAEEIVRAYRLARERGFRVGRPGPANCDFCSDERGRRGAVVNADGNLFSCWDSVGHPGYEVGTVTDGYIDYPKDRWVSCGSFAESHGAADAIRRFNDEIDSGVLDLLRSHRIPQRAA